LLLRAREILGLGETMRQEAADARGLKRGTLRIGSFGPTSSLRLLPKILDEYRKEYPGIEVRIDEGADLEVIQWIQDRRVDIGFVVLPDDRFDTVPIAEDQLVALLPSAHPLAGQPDVRLEALCDAPFILTQAGSATLVERIFAAAKLVPKIRYRSAQLISTLGMVERGDGVTILAELALPEVDSARPAAYVKRPLNPPVRRSIGLAVHNQRQASPATQAFIEIATRLQRQGLLSGTGHLK
jgi:DNA-binding transcriptional LysR family regulator